MIMNLKQRKIKIELQHIHKHKPSQYKINIRIRKTKFVIGALYYSRNRRSVNAKNNFWNVYCSTTNQIRDVTATVISKKVSILLSRNDFFVYIKS